MSEHRGEGQLFGYARVSTKARQNEDGERTAGQDVGLQVDDLLRAGVPEARIFKDEVSGAKADRPGLTAVMAAMGDGDTLVVWRLDRLGRSMLHLVGLVEEMRSRGIVLRSLRDGVDTSTPTGRMMLGILASLAEMEREVIRERVTAGMAAAKARGKGVGRRSALKPDQVRMAVELRGQGKSIREIASGLGGRYGTPSPETVRRALLKAGVDTGAEQ